MELKERYLNAKRALFNKAYSSLNEKQREAVFTVRGPLLVLAGAGSGKTTVLVKRIAFIIKYGDAYYSNYVPYGINAEAVEKLENAIRLPAGDIENILPEFISEPCPPWQMLAITFTNKAANEIKSRLAAAFDDASVSNQIWSGTFHSVCMKILRINAEAAGLDKNFSVYDTDDTKRAVLAAMKTLNIDEKSLPVKTVINAIGRAKDKLTTPEDYLAEAGNDFRLKQIARIYAEYQRRLKESNALDFDDIIMRTVFLFRDNEEVRRSYQNKFRYVCVDEYQDTNKAQFELTKLLAGGYRNIMVVGDDDQSIYKFRGATIENILNFDKEYKDAKVVKLEQNYRSTQNILDAANSVISHNSGRMGKQLWTGKGSGDMITLRQCDDQNAEARYITDCVNECVASGARHYKDFAILYRTNAQSSVIERVFARSGMPYRMLGGLRFNDRKEIRDVVAYLQLICNHSDKERLLRIINEPKRKIGDKTLDGIEAIAREKNCSMFEVIENADKYAALSRSKDILLSFAELINGLAALLDSGIPLDAFVNCVLDRSGYRQMLRDAGEAEAERLDNIEEFISGVIEYQNNAEEPSLPGFLEENALVADVDKYDADADAVVMMTIHSAKGLEFPIVFLPGMEDGIFPGMQTIMASDAEMEEERRLAYVAITRAKDKLYILHTKNRMLYGRTTYNPISRFVGEIPSELVSDETPVPAVKNDVQVKEYFKAQRSKPSFDDTVTVNKPLFTKAPASKGSAFSEGDRVSHITFGTGEVLSVTPMGTDILYEIRFDRVGTKKLMASYARLRKAD